MKKILIFTFLLLLNNICFSAEQNPEIKKINSNRQNILSSVQTENNINISNKPITKNNYPNPKASLLPKHPYPKYFMQVPQEENFEFVNNEEGKYSINIPKTFGKDYLADLPYAHGPMLMRANSEILMCAITVLDPLDNISFKNNQPLPNYLNKQTLLTWTHGNDLIWHCTLSKHLDFYGNKLLLEAYAKNKERTYQMFFVMPIDKYGFYLPQALYSLNSFKEILQ